jgi:hypothetical protein
VEISAASVQAMSNLSQRTKIILNVLFLAVLWMLAKRFGGGLITRFPALAWDKTTLIGEKSASKRRICTGPSAPSMMPIGVRLGLWFRGYSERRFCWTFPRQQPRHYLSRLFDAPESALLN